MRKVKRVGPTEGVVTKERPVRRPEHLGELLAGDGPYPTKPLEVSQAAYEHDVL